MPIGLFVAGLQVAAAVGQETPDQPRFRIDVRAAAYEVRVLDADRKPIRGLTAEDFLVLEDGAARPVVQLRENPSPGLSVAMLLDIGSTMSREKILLGRRLMHGLVHLLDRDDEILLGVYAQDVDFVSELSSDRYHLSQSIELIGSGARPGKWKRLGNLFMSSALTGYAVDHALLQLKKANNPDKIVMVISAGFGGIGEATLDHLHTAGARFFGVSLPNRKGDVLSLGGDQSARKRIVRRTGGIAYSGQEALAKIESLRDAMRHYYLLAYEPAPGDDDWTKRKVRFRIPGQPQATVHAVRRSAGRRSSFY